MKYVVFSMDRALNKILGHYTVDDHAKIAPCHRVQVALLDAAGDGIGNGVLIEGVGIKRGYSKIVHYYVVAKRFSNSGGKR